MSYKKILVDNITCSRRFHITFDDQADVKPRVELKCRLCGTTIFAADNHAPVTLARDENLVKTSSLSLNIVEACAFEDELSKKTIHHQPQRAGGPAE